MSGVDILNLAERRMSYLENRQSVLAGNVANANTPNYRPKDVSPFQGVLEEELNGRGSVRKTEMARTDPSHMTGPTGSNRTHVVKSRGSLDGNHVVLEDEMTKAADNNDQQRLASSAYGRYMGMYGMAIGGSGG